MGESKRKQKQKESELLERTIATALQDTWRSKLYPHCRDDADLCCQRMLDAGFGDLQKLQTSSGDEIRAALNQRGTSELRDIGCDVVLEVCEKLREQPTLQVYFTKESSKSTCKPEHEVNEPDVGTAKVGKLHSEKPQTEPKKLAKPKAKAALDERECDLWQHAMHKAKKEMEKEFQHDLLCTQGRTLYQYVLTDKAKRLHSKLKARRKWKQKQAGILKTHPGSERTYIGPLD